MRVLGGAGGGERLAVQKQPPAPFNQPQVGEFAVWVSEGGRVGGGEGHRAITGAQRDVGVMGDTHQLLFSHLSLF